MMLRSTLLCLAWLLASSSALAQSAPPPAAPAAAAPASPVATPQAATGAAHPAAASSAAPPQPPSAAQASPPPPAATTSGVAEPARKVRLHVTVDVIDPSRDVRDIISELRARRPDGPRPQTSPTSTELRDRAPAAIGRELRTANSELRGDRHEQRLDRLEHRQDSKTTPGAKPLRPVGRKADR